MEHAKNKSGRYSLIVIMALVNAEIYGIVYLRSGFYNIMQEAMGLTHTEMGNIWTVYGIVATISYLFGGFLADYVNARKLIVISLIGIIISGITLSFMPSYKVLMVIYALMGIFAIFTYYPASIKTISILSQKTGNGKGFGSYWSFVYAVNILTSLLGIGIVNHLQQNEELALRIVIWLYVLFAGIALLLFLVFFRIPEVKTIYVQSWSFRDAISIMKNKKVWLISFLIFTNYLVMSSFSYFTPFMREVLRFPETRILAINLVKGELLGTVITMVIGIAADKLGSAIKMILIMNVIGISFLIAFLFISRWKLGIVFSVLVLILVNISFNGAKGILMATLPESGIQTSISGSAIGVISFIGYMPDAFYYSIAGRVLEENGEFGYTYLFLFSVIFAFISCVCCYLLIKNNQKGGMG